MKNLVNPANAAEIRSRILTLTSSDVPQWGIMTVNQMVCHLRQAFIFALDNTPVEPLKGPLPPRVLKFAALRTPGQWPHSVPTPSLLLPDAPGMVCTTFDNDRDTLLATFDDFCSLANHTRDHPFFGSMDHADWMRWGYLHCDHHLRQFNR